MLSGSQDSMRRTNISVGYERLPCIASHESTMVQFPPAALREATGKPTLSCGVEILPFLDMSEVYEKFHRNEPWDSAHNKLLAKMPPEFRSDPALGVPDRRTTMMVFVGERTPFGSEKGPRMEDIKDGAANTILFVEAGPDKAVPWSKPQELPFDPENPIAALGKIPDEGFLAVTFDGSIHRIPKDIPAATLKALITHDGGETVDWKGIKTVLSRAEKKPDH